MPLPTSNAAPLPTPSGPSGWPEVTRRSRGQFWLLHVGGWAGVFLVGYLSLLNNSKPEGFARVWFAVAATGFFGTLVLRQLIRRLADRPPLHIASLLVVPALGVSAAMAMTYEVFARMHWCGGCEPFSPLGFATYTAFQMYVVAGWCSLYLVITTTRQLQRQTEALLTATDRAHQAHMKMLRYQLTPHFLFNTLNAVSTLLLDRDTPTAHRMVHGLSAFLRYTLDADPMQRVTLRQEVEALSLYLDIERIRFSDRMTVTIRVSPECWDALMPSLLLQPLIENAVKFAVARNACGAAIEVDARREAEWLLVSVADDGPGPNRAPQLDDARGPQGRSRVGLSNTRERLRAVYGDRQAVRAAPRTPHGFVAEVQIPFEIEMVAAG